MENERWEDCPRCKGIKGHDDCPECYGAGGWILATDSDPEPTEVGA